VMLSVTIAVCSVAKKTWFYCRSPCLHLHTYNTLYRCVYVLFVLSQLRWRALRIATFV